MRPVSRETRSPAGEQPLTATGKLIRRPLSPAQEGIALQQRAAPGSAIFNIPAAIELTGELDEAALRRSLTDIMRRHDVLRTTFPDTTGEPVQTVHPTYRADLPARDLRYLPPADRNSTAQALLDAEAARPFDLAREPGLRCLLVALDDDRHIFFWMMHHIVCDGWSKSIIATELSRLYTAHHTGTHPGLPELTASYGDFVARQRALAPGVLDRQLRYWARELDGVAELPPLPADLTGRVQPNAHGESIDIGISGEDTRRLLSLARQDRATLFMALHACWAIVLNRFCGQPDLVITTPYGGRPAPEFEPLIGFFVNILPLRVRLHADPSFRDLLGQVRAAALNGYENSQVAFHQVARQVADTGSGRIGALNQSSLAFANAPYEDMHLTGLAVDRYPVARVDIRFPLEMHLWEKGADEGIGGRLIYRTDLFTRHTGRSLAQAFHAAAQAVVGSPGVPVSRLAVPLDPAATPRHKPVSSSGPVPHQLPEASTATETAVLDIWEELLHTDEISVTDSFPDVGGHSLLVALMVAKIREEFGVDLAVPSIYQDPTARGVAAAIDSALHARTPADGGNQQ